MIYNSLQHGQSTGDLPQLLKLTEPVWRTRANGHFWSYMLLAEGSVDVVAEHRLKVFDIAALVQIIEQSGGKISNLHGDHTETSSSALVTNKVLHGKLRDLFQAAG